jgi:hypothetical protein
MPQSRRAARFGECPLLGEQPTGSGNAATSDFDPKLPSQRSRGSERCGQSRPCAHKWEPHGAGQAEA